MIINSQEASATSKTNSQSSDSKNSQTSSTQKIPQNSSSTANSQTPKAREFQCRYDA